MNISEKMIREIIVKVLEERDTGIGECQRQVDPSGVIGIKTSTVKLEPFEGRKDVKLKDVTSLEEAPRMDGFLDCCDAIFSRRDLEERRRILKDPHSGSFAVIGLGAVFLLQFSLFACADLSGRLWGLLFLPVVSRLCSVRALYRCEPMPGSSYAGEFKKLIKPQYGNLTSCLLLLACVLPVLIFRVPGLSAPAAAVGSLLAIWFGRRQLGGMAIAVEESASVMQKRFAQQFAVGRSVSAWST